MSHTHTLCQAVGGDASNSPDEATEVRDIEGETMGQHLLIYAAVSQIVFPHISGDLAEWLNVIHLIKCQLYLVLLK